MTPSDPATIELPATMPVTVVVPVHREGFDALPTLEAALRQRPKAVHVVLTAEDATTQAVVEALAQAHPQVTILQAVGAMPGEARNAGTAAATTPWIAYLDAGTVPDDTWLATVYRAVATDNGDAAFPFVTADVRRPIARWYALAYLPPAREADGGIMRQHHVPGMIVRREVWEAVGGFPNLRAAEDNVFVAQLAGRRLVEAPEARITWSGPDSWRAIWRRTVLYTAATWKAGQADWSAGFWRWWGVVAVGVLGFRRRGALVVLFLQVFRAARRVERHHLDPELGQRQFWDVLGTTLAVSLIDVAMLVGIVRACVSSSSLPTDWTDGGTR